METVTRKVRLLPNTGGSNSTVFVLGATGSGKTTLIANLLTERIRFIIFDTRNEYEPEFFEACVVCHGVAHFCDSVNHGELRIVFKFATGDEQEQIINECLLFLHDFQVANSRKEIPPVTVAIDELNKFVSGQTTCSGLEEIIMRGRGPAIEKVFGAQWFGTIPTWVRDTFSEIYAFRHSDKNGLARLEDYGLESEKVKNLPPFTCLYIGAGEVKTIRLKPESASE